jgi:succinyl-CoA synthetase beta subunit
VTLDRRFDDFHVLRHVHARVPRGDGRAFDGDHALEQLRQRQGEEADTGVEVNGRFLRLHVRRVPADEIEHGREEVAIDLKEGVGGEAVRADAELGVFDELTAEFPNVTPSVSEGPGRVGRGDRAIPPAQVPRYARDDMRGLDSDHLALRHQRHHAIRAHGVKTDGVAIAMKARSQPVIERRGMNRDGRMLADLADASQRLGEDAFFRLELFVEAQRRPIATAAFVRDRAGHGPAEGAGLQQLEQLRAGEALFHFEQAHPGRIAGEDVDGEDGEPVHPREGRAARDELGGRDGDFVACLIQNAPPMKVHEYQAKEILRRYGVPTPRGIVVTNPEEARQAAKELGGRVVVKAQIHAGGRGKGGGVKLAKDADDAAELAKKILGMTLITHQTGPEGRIVHKVLIEEALNLDKELYLAITLDRASGMNVMMASAQGGMDIEEVAAHDPKAIHREPIDTVLGVQPFQARQIAYALGLTGEPFKQCVSFVQKLFRAYVETDASLAEINPLLVTKEGNVLALDCKMNFDDNALYRHKDIVEMRDLGEEDPLEVEASQFGLNYIKLDGNVGCMVNGAGLAMATMDIIKLAGGEPANFLDVGGGASAEQVKNAFRIILSDKNVKAILINIFGGIMRGDRIAEGVVSASREVGLPVPVVVRLEGTNVDLGKQILRDSGLPIITADGMWDAATKVVAAAKGQ